MKPVLLEPSRIDDAAAVLARGFQDDSFQCYIIPDEEERWRLSPSIFAVLVRYGVLAGEVWTTEGKIRGVAGRPG